MSSTKQFLIAILLSALAMPAMAQRSRQPKKKSAAKEPYYSSLGLGRTLPENVMRVRFPTKFGRGTYGFDEDGNKEHLGLSLEAVGAAVVLEYGLTHDFSLQMVAPYVMKNQLSLNQDTFGRSERYKKEYANAVGLMAGLLLKNGICSSLSACVNLIEGGFALPSDTPVTLPTGEQLVIKAGVPLKNYADQVVRTAATPSDGATGLGDIEIGGLYSLYRSKIQNVAIGFGVRIPTGESEKVPAAQRRTGNGTTTLGLRLNYDYRLIRGLWLSFQNQSEYALTKAKRRKSSLLDPNKLNEADPTTPEALASGSDGEDNEQEFQTKGVRNKGLIQLDWGLTSLHSMLQPWAIKTAYLYDYRPEELIDGKSQGPNYQLQSAAFGVKFDGLGLDSRLPFNVDWEHEVPLSGKNVPLAGTSDTYRVTAYYRF